MTASRARRAVVTGGAGFVGSHLCRRLLAEGLEVVCVDSLLTGERGNVEELLTHPRFTLIVTDVSQGLDVDGPVDLIFHFASPASPLDYARLPVETLRVGALGTLNALDVGRDRKATFVLASTSEVYGSPTVHPQPETYWGNVNPVGPRSVYDEAKRFAEAATMAFCRTHGLSVRIARIFNTYGPRMRRGDGRAIPTFIAQALSGQSITVHGNGTQTRSLCYMDDLVEGIWRLAMSSVCEPINIGNPEEVTIAQLAEIVRAVAGSSSEIVFTPRPQDDPETRCPDITVARERLGWEPTVSLADGLARTVEWAKVEWFDAGDRSSR